MEIARDGDGSGYGYGGGGAGKHQRNRSGSWQPVAGVGPFGGGLGNPVLRFTGKSRYELGDISRTIVTGVAKGIARQVIGGAAGDWETPSTARRLRTSSSSSSSSFSSSTAAVALRRRQRRRRRSTAEWQRRRGR